MRINYANILTIYRIIGSVLLLAFDTFSFEFYLIYISIGLSDIFDGIIARKMRMVSEFGAKLDSIADIIMVIIVLFKILTVINIYKWMYIWIIIIFIIKIINIISALIIHKKIIMLHTKLNKLCGFILFILPFIFNIIDIKYSFIFFGILATFAAIQEGHYIRTGRIYG